MTKEAAIQRFFSQFLPAYEENSVANSIYFGVLGIDGFIMVLFAGTLLNATLSINKLYQEEGDTLVLECN